MVVAWDRRACPRLIWWDRVSRTPSCFFCIVHHRSDQKGLVAFCLSSVKLWLFRSLDKSPWSCSSPWTGCFWAICCSSYAKFIAVADIKNCKTSEWQYYTQRLVLIDLTVYFPFHRHPDWPAVGRRRKTYRSGQIVYRSYVKHYYVWTDHDPYFYSLVNILPAFQLLVTEPDWP